VQGFGSEADLLPAMIANRRRPIHVTLVFITGARVKKDISPYFWLNGTMPRSNEFDALVADGFKSFILRVDGLVKTPKDFSYAELKAVPKQEQITTHFCIQGWSGVAKWSGVPMRHILEVVRPTREPVTLFSTHLPTAARPGVTMTYIEYPICAMS
jgi:DMSO/TMAO reductase YedYZ molybdopterin-dependent catalytic subunit